MPGWIAAGAAVAGTAAQIGGQIADGGGGSGSTTSSQTPYGSGYVDNANQVAWNLLNQHYAGQPNYGFPGMSSPSQDAINRLNTYGGFSNDFLEQGQKDAQNFGIGKHVGTNAAYGYLSPMAAGGASNPFLDATYDQAAGKVRSSLDSQFEGAGRYGSGGHQNAVGGALGDLATSLYGGQYNADQNRALQAGSVIGQLNQNERQQQLAGLGILPGISQAQTQNNLGLLQGGQYQDAYNYQNYMNPMQLTQSYANIVRGNGTGSETKPYFTNNAGNYAALAQGVGDLGQKAYDWWNSSNSGVADPTYLKNMNTGLTDYGHGGF